MKRYIYIIVSLLFLFFTTKGQNTDKQWSDKVRCSDLIGRYNIEEDFFAESLELQRFAGSLELQKDSFFYSQTYPGDYSREDLTIEEKGVWIKKGDTIQCVKIYDENEICPSLAGTYLIRPQGLVKLEFGIKSSVIYKNVSAPVHFTERTMPNIIFSEPCSTHLRGTICTEDSADVYLGAYIRLMLEIENVLYTTNIESSSDLDNVFYISYPDYLSQSLDVKEFLMIERVGFQRQLININSPGHKKVLNVTLQPQSAFPTIHIRKGEYHIDLSPLASIGWKLPVPSIDFREFYKSICYILQKSGHKDMTLRLKFSKNGELEEVNGKDTYGGITYFLKELKWLPARVYNGRVIPLEILLNVVVERDN